MKRHIATTLVCMALITPAHADPEPKTHDAAHLLGGAVIGWACREYTEAPIPACAVGAAFVGFTVEMFANQNVSKLDGLQWGVGGAIGAGGHEVTRRIVTIRWGGEGAGVKWFGM